MKKKQKNNIKRTVTFLIVFGIGLTLLATWGGLRIQVESQTESSSQTPSNYTLITENSTFQTLKDSTTKSLVLFTSNWCGACSSMKEKLIKLALTYPDINFYVADIETFRAYSNSYNVAITPALVLIEGTNFSTIQEVRPEVLETTVEEFSLLGI